MTYVDIHDDEKTEFTFDELSPRAKARAREWWAERESEDFDGSQVKEDAEQIAGILGIDIKQNTRHVAGGRGHKPRTYTESAIYWSGFGNQGDGACFEGRYSYRPEACAEIRAHAGTDAELHRIADELHLLSTPARMTFCAGTVTLDGEEWHVTPPSTALCAIITHSGYYSNSASMNFEVCNDETGEEVDNEKARAVAALLRAFADWIYAHFRDEYEYITSDEAATDALSDSDYLFDEDGEFVG